MNTEKLKALAIAPEAKRRSQRSLWAIFVVIALATGAAVWLAWPRASDRTRVFGRAAAAGVLGQARAATTNDLVAETQSTNVVLTVSGYVINRARIEISPRFPGVVQWIGVKKGDSVTNGQVVVLLDDTEYRARLREAEGRWAAARATLARAELTFERVKQLARTDIESRQAYDDARLAVEEAQALVTQAEGARQLAQTYLDWCTIRAPVDGVVLERLVDENELVVPQSFGGPRGPSTALVAVANPRDLQVEIDLNEADLAKVFLHQKCRVSPEAYPDRTYAGVVAEIAPEANRSKGTLQIKVQILEPDRYLTPELSAKVDFLRP